MGMVCLIRRGISGDNETDAARMLSLGGQRFVALSVSLILSSYNDPKALIIARRGALLSLQWNKSCSRARFVTCARFANNRAIWPVYVNLIARAYPD
jgi:hypothetical protein